MNKLRKQEQEMRQDAAKQSESNTYSQLNTLEKQLAEAREKLGQTIIEGQQERSKLTFECEDAKFKYMHA